MKRIFAAALILISINIKAFHNVKVNFESDNWKIITGKVEEHLGRTCFQGYGMVKDMIFEDGIIEVDIAVNGKRSYPGIIFRQQSSINKERFYIRPHRAGLYDDAFQYVPTINGIDAWQIYNGPGYTAIYDDIVNEWIHFKIEIQGTRAQVFIDDSKIPALEIFNLEHEKSSGLIGLLGPMDSSAYFSNLSYTVDTILNFPDLPVKVRKQNIIKKWEIAEPIKDKDIKHYEKYPSKDILSNLTWKNCVADKNGYIDLAKFITPKQRPYVTIAKTQIESTTGGVQKLNFGYSDIIYVFVNGKIVFCGDNSYRSRDSGFLGAVGLHDAVFVDLQKGQNEILIILKDIFGGWGFIFQKEDKDGIINNQFLESVWESDNQFNVPETTVYDKKNNCVYISNYDGYVFSNNKGLQTIAKLNLTDYSINHKWIDGLNNPMGMAIKDNFLYVVEGNALVRIDITKAEIEERMSFNKVGMLNDIAVSDNLMLLTDFRGNKIFEFKDNTLSEWFSSDLLMNPNGIEIYKDEVYVLTDKDHALKRIDVKEKEINTIKRFETGLMDGIELDDFGNIYISLNEGQIFRIQNDEVTEILNTQGSGCIANFELIPERNYLIVPTFTDNSVSVYKFRDKFQ